MTQYYRNNSEILANPLKIENINHSNENHEASSVKSIFLKLSCYVDTW